MLGPSLYSAPSSVPAVPSVSAVTPALPGKSTAITNYVYNKCSVYFVTVSWLR